MEELLKIFLPAYLVLYFGIAFIWRSIAVYRATGVNPYVLGGSDNAYDYVGVVFRITFLLVVATVIQYSFFSGLTAYVVPIFWLEYDLLHSAGIVLLIVSLVWTAVAQIQMGSSWRIGIDLANRTALVNKGLFTVSRNPIFLGMRVALVGFFFAIPNAVTLLTLVLGDVLMQIQARLEEEHLAGLHGEKYLNYKGTVRRWI